jgi:hypothetical protein
MFGLVWQGRVLKQRYGGIYRSWMPSQGHWMYWFPPYDDESDPETTVRTIARRHNVLYKLSAASDGEFG